MQWTPEIRCTGPCLPAAPLKALPMSIALPLPSALAEALAQRGYDALTQVQSAVLADGLAGKDLLVSAQTGSGKTVAFGLAMAADLLAGAETLERADTPLAVIVAPTRELAQQVARAVRQVAGACRQRLPAPAARSCPGGIPARIEDWGGWWVHPGWLRGAT